MLTSINLKNVASFTREGILLSDLNKINIIYGTNGTGKTTISDYLHNHNKDNEKYIGCEVAWSEANEESEILVYNRNFVKQSLAETDAIQGIFTIGDDAEEKKQLMTNLEEENNKLETKQIRNELNLNTKIDSISSSYGHFKDLCWEKYNIYKNSLGASFNPYRGSKSDFVYKIIQTYECECNC